jgi:exosortase
LNSQSVSPPIPAAHIPRPWLLLATLAALWLLVINQLRFEWSINPQYTYGWTVPFLALYLFYERWRCRPIPSPFRRRTAIYTLATFLALSLFPIRLIQESAPDWRLLGWVIAGAVSGLTLCGLLLTGGWHWLRHFGFPVLFFLVAVPWPMPFEQSLIQMLMRSIASICVEALSLWGMPAVQHGNVIELPTGAVGIEEACSGVRSLQTTLMTSLFLGELLRLNLWRRAALLLGGVAIAFICNAGRALFLVGISVRHGNAQVEQWHDTVGLTVLLVSLAAVGGVASLLRSRKNESVETKDSQPVPQGAAICKGGLIGLLVWLVAIEAGTEVWYRSHEAGYAQSTPWWIEFPKHKLGYRNLPIAERAKVILHYDEGSSATWLGNDGSRWSAFFLRWFPGRASAQLAKAHGPEICLPSAGTRMRTDFGVKIHEVHGIRLPVHAYEFVMQDRPLHVFFALWEDRVAPDPLASRWQKMSGRSRLQGVLTGRRNTGQQVVELAVLGYSDAATAEAAFLRELESMLRK